MPSVSLALFPDGTALVACPKVGHTTLATVATVWGLPYQCSHRQALTLLADAKALIILWRPPRDRIRSLLNAAGTSRHIALELGIHTTTTTPTTSPTTTHLTLDTLWGALRAAHRGVPWPPSDPSLNAPSEGIAPSNTGTRRRKPFGRLIHLAPVAPRLAPFLKSGKPVEFLPLEALSGWLAGAADRFGYSPGDCAEFHAWARGPQDRPADFRWNVSVGEPVVPPGQDIPRDVEAMYEEDFLLDKVVRKQIKWR